MQVTGWETAARGRFSAVASATGIPPGATLGGRSIAKLGVLRTLQLGLVSLVLQSALLARAMRGHHFYWAQPVGMLAIGGRTALSAITILEGDAAGLARGELQGATSSLQMMVQVLAPLVWSRLHQAGVRAGRPGCFYHGLVAVHLARLLVTATLGHEPRPPREAAVAATPALGIVHRNKRV